MTGHVLSFDFEFENFAHATRFHCRRYYAAAQLHQPDEDRQHSLNRLSARYVEEMIDHENPLF
jgi:hypothetical protein